MIRVIFAAAVPLLCIGAAKLVNPATPFWFAALVCIVSAPLVGLALFKRCT